MYTKSLTPFAITFALRVVWNTIAGVLYIFFIGTGRKIDNPPMDSFFAIFLALSFYVLLTYNSCQLIISGGMLLMSAALSLAELPMLFSFILI